MKLDPIEQDIFERVLQTFFNKYGKQKGIEILRDIYNLHREMNRELVINRFPIAQIYHHIIYMMLETDQSEGGYSGMPIKEIAKAEKIGERRLYRIINHYVKKTRRNHRILNSKENP